jgi:hypothetical protein
LNYKWTKQSALHAAARAKHSHMIQVLVDAKADLNALTEEVSALILVQHIELKIKVVSIVLSDGNRT